MSGNLVNVDVGEISSGLFSLIDSLFTTEDDRMKAKLKLLELQQQGQLAQMEVNKTEAQHETIFVAGWRPFIGWVCGLAFAYHFIFQPIFMFCAWLYSGYSGVELPFETLPELDMTSLLAVLGGILGLGGLRTYEKRTGVNMNRGKLPKAMGDGTLY